MKKIKKVKKEKKHIVEIHIYIHKDLPNSGGSGTVTFTPYNPQYKIGDFPVTLC